MNRRSFLRAAAILPAAAPLIVSASSSESVTSSVSADPDELELTLRAARIASAKRDLVLFDFGDGKAGISLWS